MRDKTFLIMAGGTGGHVFPALATAQKLLEQKDKVVWLGSVGGMEEGLVKSAGIPFYGISVKGFRGKGFINQLVAPLKIMYAVFQAFNVILAVKPDAVLGMGGFASGPGGVAARVMGKPLLIHEQNAVAGLTNRLLSKVATSIMTAFPGAFSEQVDVKLTGNPLREDICDLYYQPLKGVVKARNVHLLILGGSLGAASLNDNVPGAMGHLEESIRPDIWHQTGKGKDLQTSESYKKLCVDAKVSAFIGDMAEAYAWADFVICRAGALTISELCTVGLGAILIPFPFAVDDHQTRNAEMMTEEGAAWLLPQADLNADSLAEILKPLLIKQERISILSKAAHKIAHPDATEKVVNECRRVCYA